jgi:hypothetical protein
MPNLTLGPQLGCNLMKENGLGVIDVVASAGHSLLLRQWRYAYYDLGFNWSMSLKNIGEASGGDTVKSYEKNRKLFGIGVRFNHSYRSDRPNYLNFYFSFGWRFN